MQTEPRDRSDMPEPEKQERELEEELEHLEEDVREEGLLATLRRILRTLLGRGKTNG